MTDMQGLNFFEEPAFLTEMIFLYMILGVWKPPVFTGKYLVKEDYKMKGSLLVLVILLSTVFTFSTVFAQDTGSGVRIERMVIATSVENREPQGVAEVFPATTEKVYCFIEARNIAQDSQVVLVWYHGNNEMLRTPLNLRQGFRWRTYAYKNLHGMKGEWRVDLLDSEGKLLKSVSFKVE